MREKHLRRGFSVIATLAGVYAAHQLFRRFLIEDTAWMFTAPRWILWMGGLSLVLAPSAWVLEWIWKRTHPIDEKTLDVLHEITRRKNGCI